MRNILYFDFIMKPYPDDAPSINLEELIDHLIVRCQNGLAVEQIDAGKRIIRLLDIKKVRSDNKSAVALLLCLADADKSDSGVTNIKTGEVRILDKFDDELGCCCAHLLVNLTPTEKDGYIYNAILEDISGLGKTLIQSFMRTQFRNICKDTGYSFQREKNDNVKTRPLVELAGHASEELVQSLKTGSLQYIELNNYHQIDWGFDEGKYLKSSSRKINISVSKKLPQSDTMNFLEKIRTYAKEAGYDTMRVRWKVPSQSKPQTAKIDTDKKDTSEAVFIKTSEIQLINPLEEVSSMICVELINSMQKHLK